MDTNTRIDRRAPFQQSHLCYDCRPTLQVNSGITTTSVDEALAESSTESSDRIFVFVTDDLVVERTSGGHGWRGNFRLLNKNHTKGNESALTNEVNTILSHGFEYLHSILETGTRTSDTQSKGGATSDVGVVALTEQLDNTWDGRGILEQEEGE